MSKEDPPGVPSDAGSGAGSEAPTGMATPTAGLISQVVKKIRNEPFLFVIAIAALLIGLVVQGTGLARPDLRFFITIIALLAFVVIAGYYLLEGWKLYSETRSESPASSRPTGRSIWGWVKVGILSKDAQVTGIRAVDKELNYPGQITGTAEVGEAEGGSAIGVDFGGGDQEE